MNTDTKIVRIGTRGSPLALRQADMVRGALEEKFPYIGTEIVVIKTSGDWDPAQGDVRLSETEGGKGQFAKEIEAALLAGEIDAAVHSMKDMDSHSPEGLVIDCMLEREDPRDGLLLSPSLKKSADYSQKNVRPFDALPAGAVVGTASVRRAAFMLAERPDLKIVPFRGNVQTRIDKLEAGVAEPKVDCTLLALAGLNRLGLSEVVDVIMEPEEMLPSAGQGAVGVQVRAGDPEILSIFSQINHLKTTLCVKAERAAVGVLDGSCHTPVGGYAVLEGNEMWLRVRVCSLDGAQNYHDEMREEVRSAQDAEALGAKLGQKLKQHIPAGILNDG